MSTLFVPEVNKRVDRAGKSTKIEWPTLRRQLYKMNATLSSVEQGVNRHRWCFTTQRKMAAVAFHRNAVYHRRLRIILRRHGQGVPRSKLRRRTTM